MRTGRIVRRIFYVLWGVAGLPLLISDIIVYFWHPGWREIVLQTLLALGIVAIPYLVWRYGGGRAQMIRDRHARRAREVIPPLPLWRRSNVEIAVDLYGLFQRGRFAFVCVLAVLTCVMLLMGLTTTSLNAAKK